MKSSGPKSCFTKRPPTHVRRKTTTTMSQIKK